MNSAWPLHECPEHETSPISSSSSTASSVNSYVLVPPHSSVIEPEPNLDESYSAYHPVPLTIEHFNQAFRDFQPTAVSKPPPSSSHTFNDIGGMHSIKQTLKDTLELPTRFMRLFARIPLKLRSGLLLYGPPGSGKTFIASALANECNLNLISVKGPELLSKYIGSSESSVRDLFARARTAAPSLIFLDELDSLCPKRGGDTTGVTDRIVNQFLCELDGVETGSSEATISYGAVEKNNKDEIDRAKLVFILGATSRPDMIDAALLRPGRLDKLLYCPLPDLNARREILMVSVRKLFSTVDEQAIGLTQEIQDLIGTISRNTEGFSGADLQSIVTNAQLLRVHDAIESLNNTKLSISSIQDSSSVTVEPTLPPLTSSMLWKAYQQSSASLSTADATMYSSIYSRFLLNKEGKLGVTFDPNVKQRTAQA